MIRKKEGYKMKERKKEFYDDGRTIASMDFHNFTTFSTITAKKENQIKKQHESDLNLTWKERFAVIVALYMTLIPFVIILFLIFFIVFGIIFTIWR